VLTLRSQLDALASNFAKAIVAALQGASLHELVGSDGGWASSGRKPRTVSSAVTPTPTAPKAGPRKPGRLPRRSAEEIQAELDKIVSLVRKHKDGLRAEEIRSNLGMQSKEMPRILKEGISKKKLTSKGQKRATTYFAK
jgi:hypothetical protein